MASAISNEAQGAGAVFEFKGVKYLVPPSDEWPIEVAEALEAERFLAAAAAMLGKEQWAKFKRGNRTGDAEAFFNALGEAIGANPTL